MPGARPNHPGRGLFQGAYTKHIRGRRSKRIRAECLPVAGGTRLTVAIADTIRRGEALTAVVPLPIETTPACPAARTVFTPHEMDARLAALAELAAQRKPLSGGGKGERKLKPRATCWACGKRCPHPTHPRMVGWACRIAPGVNGDVVEVYCVPCHQKWGWPKVGKTALHSPCGRRT